MLQEPVFDEWGKQPMPRELRSGEYPFFVAIEGRYGGAALISDRVVLTVYPNLIFGGDVFVGSNDVKTSKRYRVIETVLIEGDILYDYTLGILNEPVDVGSSLPIANLSTLWRVGDEAVVLSWLRNKAQKTTMYFGKCESRWYNCIENEGHVGPCHFRLGDMLLNKNGDLVGGLFNENNSPCVVNDDAVWTVRMFDAKQLNQIQIAIKQAESLPTKPLVAPNRLVSAFGKYALDVHSSTAMSLLKSNYRRTVAPVTKQSTDSVATSNAPISPLNEIKPPFFIINGTTAKSGEFPYVAAIVAGESKRPFCTGVIISNRAVLTAGRCLRHIEDPEEVFVRVGPVKYKSGILYDIESFKEHKKRSGLINDIGLLVTEDEMEFDAKIEAIKLPTKERNYDNANLTVISWGGVTDEKKSNRLMHTYTFGVPSDECDIDDERILCIHNNGSLPCNGDSGGLVVYRRSNGKPELAALISGTSASDCSTNPRGELFSTKVYPYRRWIKKTLESCGLALINGDDDGDDDDDDDSDESYEPLETNVFNSHIEDKL